MLSQNQPQIGSKSPAEKMFESSLLQHAANLANLGLKHQKLLN